VPVVYEAENMVCPPIQESASGAAEPKNNDVAELINKCDSPKDGFSGDGTFVFPLHDCKETSVVNEFS